MAGLAVARERLNPEASIEFQKETPRESYGFSVPLELGGKRSKRIAVGEATVRAGEAEIAVVIAQVRNDVRRAYFGLLVAETRQSLMQEIRDISIRARDAAQAAFRCRRRAAARGHAGRAGARIGGQRCRRRAW